MNKTTASVCEKQHHLACHFHLSFGTACSSKSPHPLSLPTSFLKRNTPPSHVLTPALFLHKADLPNPKPTQPPPKGNERTDSAHKLPGVPRLPLPVRVGGRERVPPRCEALVLPLFILHLAPPLALAGEIHIHARGHREAEAAGHRLFITSHRSIDWVGF